MGHHMNWTPENDRILLLKLIETHGITVNAQLILDAWPQDVSERPKTARAISERFVKLRKMAGIKATVKSNTSTPRARALKTPATPNSSAKKRKGKKKNYDDSDSEDGDDHLTLSEDETETPTKASRTASTRKRSNFFGKGRLLGELPISGGGSDIGFANSSRSTMIKNESLERDGHGQESDPFRNGSFAKNLQRASELRRQNKGPLETDYSKGVSYGIPTPGGSGYDGSYYNSPSAMDGGNDHGAMIMGYGDTYVGAGGANDLRLDGVGAMNNYDMSIPDSNNMDFSSHLGMTAGDYLTDKTRNLHVSPQPTFPTVANSGARPSVTHSKSSSIGRGFDQASNQSRERSVRKASRQASEDMSAYLQGQKEVDREFGDKSSEEDSQVSEFHGSEEEFI